MRTARHQNEDGLGNLQRSPSSFLRHPYLPPPLHQKHKTLDGQPGACSRRHIHLGPWDNITQSAPNAAARQRPISDLRSAGERGGGKIAASFARDRRVQRYFVARSCGGKNDLSDVEFTVIR